MVTRRLKNGLTFLAEPMSGVRSASVTWLVPAGCAFDPVEKQGLSAMWTELVMRGAGALDSRAQADALDRLGVSRGCESGTFTLRIGATCVGERVVEALPLLVDMVRVPRMEESAIEPARDLCLQSIASVMDDPQERAMLLCKARHHASPMDRSGLGTPEGLAAITREDAAGRWAEAVRPGTSIFAVAGAIDADEVAGRLERLCEGWEGTTADPGWGKAAVRGYAHEEDASSQVQIVLAHDGPTEGSADAILEKVVLTVLSGGMSGRLFTEVREKRGLCYAVSASYRGDRDLGVVTAYVGTTQQRAQESLDVLWGELMRIQSPEGRVTEEEFERAVVGLKAGLIFSGESTAARSGALAADMRKLGRARTLAELASMIDAVTLDQVNGYLARRKMGRVTIQTLGPEALTPPPLG